MFETISIIVAIALSIVAVAFFMKGILSRRHVADTAYGVERQDVRHEMLVDLMRGVVFIVLALIAFAAYGLAPASDEPAEETLLTPAATLQATSSAVPVMLESSPTATTAPSPTPSATFELSSTSQAATAIPTVVEITARVNSPNGLWLREAPGGSQELELIADGSLLLVLEGVQTVDDLEWQRVRTESGNEGWVATDFIVYQ